MRKITAVYKITCVSNGNFYIGSSVNLQKRWYTHRLELTKGAHFNRHLQSSWNKYGKDNFKFEVLESADSQEAVLLLEQQYLDLHAGKDYCFNFALRVDAPMAGRTVSESMRAKMRQRCGENHWNWGRKLNPETIEKIRETNKKHPHHLRRHTPEEIRKIAESSRGRRHTIESKKKISIAHKGKVLPQELRDRISATLSGPGNFYYGKKREESFREKVRKRVVIEKGGKVVKEFPSILDLRKEMNMTPTTVNRALKRAVPITKGKMAGYLIRYAS